MRLELFPPSEISYKYYNSLDKLSVNSDIENKLLGKFYTTDLIANDLIASIINNIKLDKDVKEIKIIDPFCGDGRLVVNLIKKLNNNLKLKSLCYSVTLWDIDKVGLDLAVYNLKKLADNNNILIEIEASHGDAFIKYREMQGNFDICITNPPWGILKPAKFLSREESKSLLSEYKIALEEYDDYLSHEFKISAPTRKFGKWGTNLARSGVELAMRLINDNGYVAVVSPSSLFTDQVSVTLRNWIFSNFETLEISYFPATLKLFDKVDMATVSFLSTREKLNKKVRISTYTKENIGPKREKLNSDDFNYIEDNDYIFPLKLGIESIPILRKSQKLPTVIEYTEINNLKFTREMDETRFKEKVQDSGNIVFAKGYMVDRYSFKPDGYFLNEEKVSPPQSVEQYKLVWRDVSRDTQVRRIKASILPPGHICGNSLGVISGDSKSLDKLKILLAVFNSMIFEYQARAKLVSNHVSAGVIKQLHVPEVTNNLSIIRLVDKNLNSEGNFEDELEIEVAHMYQISYEDFSKIVNYFSIDSSRKSKLLNLYKMN